MGIYHMFLLACVNWFQGRAMQVLAILMISIYLECWVLKCWERGVLLLFQCSVEAFVGFVVCWWINIQNMAIGVSSQDVYIITHQKFVSAIITSVQNPPDGPFNSKDLIWHFLKRVSGQKGGAIWKVQIAYISNQWVQDVMDGREQQETHLPNLQGESSRQTVMRVSNFHAWITTLSSLGEGIVSPC